MVQLLFYLRGIVCNRIKLDKGNNVCKNSTDKKFHKFNKPFKVLENWIQIVYTQIFT